MSDNAAVHTEWEKSEGHDHGGDGRRVAGHERHHEHPGGHSHEHESGCGCCRHTHEHAEEKTGGRAELFFFIAAAAFAAIGLLVQNRLPVQAVFAFFAVSWILSGREVIVNAVKNIARGDFFDENFLMTVATIGAFVIGEYPEAAAVMLFYNIGEMLQDAAVEKTRSSITDLMDVRPEFARLENGTKVHPRDVPAGTALTVFPGEKIPLDGVIEKGESFLDTTPMTGESAPRAAFPGERVFAGFINGNGELTIRTDTIWSQTAAAKMLSIIENSKSRKTKREKFITSFSKIYTPIVLVCAVVIAMVFPLATYYALGNTEAALGDAFRTWIYRALTFLVISCPCAFVVSVPLGYFGGIGAEAKRGILIKGAEYIDALANAGCVIFDKTGTLTTGEFSVEKIAPAEGFSEAELLRLATIAECKSKHPLGVAVCEEAKKRGVDIDSAQIPAVSETAGGGVTVEYGGQKIAAGSIRFLRGEGCVVPQEENRDENVSSIFISVGKQFAGKILLRDREKNGARDAIQTLERIGVKKIAMITGDTPQAARGTAERLGIAEFAASVLPHEKAEKFEEIAGKIKSADPSKTALFVGDGINDGAAIARADAGIAMGALGSDVAVEAADVVLMNDELTAVPESIVLARRIRRIVSENIALSISIKVLFLALGATGVIGLKLAVFADVGVALIAVLNSIRPLRWKKIM